VDTAVREPPESVAGYTVHERVGRGDFSPVYRVTDAAGTEFAMKFSDGSSRSTERLSIEAHALKRLDHPAIPKFVAAGKLSEGTPQEWPYLVMTLAKGKNLATEVKARSEAGAVHGDVEAMRVLRGLLDGLAYLHELGLVHRDIKDANIVRSPSDDVPVVIVDFGFAKEDGKSDTRLDDSFFRAGATRYSPPEKIENSGTAIASHDVFASGVIAYRLLTSQWPWSVPPTADQGEYRRALESPAVPVRDLNSRVHARVSGFVMQLLELDDSRRMSSREALEAADELLDRLRKEGPASRERFRTRINLSEVWRDPVYGDVRMTKFEWSVLDTREMQRLRKLKQLGLTNLVFAGAEHTRLAHAIGCVHRVEQILRSIEDIEGITADPETRLIARLYALIHDVPHVAYGHTIEDELGLFERHDQNLARIDRLLLSGASELGTTLERDEIGIAVRSLFSSDATIHQRSSVIELVTGSTGADVLDYIDRDAFYCGLDERIDSAIFRQFRFEGSEEQRLFSLIHGKYGIRLDREHAVESVLNVRYAMYMKVYTHNRKAAASALLGKSLGAALHPPSGRPDFTEADYEWMPDEIVLDRLGRSRKTAASVPASRLQGRHLPKAVFRGIILTDDDVTDGQFQEWHSRLKSEGVFEPAQRQRLEAELARSAGLDPSDVMLYCPPKAPGYQRIRHRVAAGPGAPTPINPATGPYYRLGVKHLRLWEAWAFSSDPDPMKCAHLAGEVSERFGLENKIALHRRAGRLF
jgi:HD superfamily phosphohydrolase